eukprot:CAMPEP_0194173340 /NCGR_PEP_ID=MMETSP0154-20130528/7690_1 /TAXON_ID=1049557 /ORGANISM="Thalassiothrix antarctica, Strain L6-D1" /LENGTH=102 /DNA_ID=CAMNT_0038886367 /DNA_START=388 /DNA_END=696 /DNA_ORIENTATION=+
MHLDYCHPKNIRTPSLVLIDLVHLLSLLILVMPGQEFELSPRSIEKLLLREVVSFDFQNVHSDLTLLLQLRGLTAIIILLLPDHLQLLQNAKVFHRHLEWPD